MIWLDDEPLTVSYDKNVLIPDRFDTDSFTIVYLEKIAELMEFLYHHTVTPDDLFIVDIMLLFEKEILTPDSRKIEIPDELMAGVTLYREFLRERYPQNPVILYTSREHDEKMFTHITSDPRFGKSLFLIDKWKKDTLFVDTLAHFLKERT